MASLIVRRDEHRLTLSLNRPEAANTLDLELAQALFAAITAPETSAARVVVIRAEGTVFCGGGDVNAMAAAESASQYLSDLAGVFHEFLGALRSLGAPVIASVRGAAAGAGLGLCLASDIVVATDRSRFLSAFASVGLSTDSGVSYHLPRVVGLQRALDLCLTGRVLDARTAQDWGIVSEVVTDDELESATDALAARLAMVPGGALAQTKRLLRAGSSDFTEHLADEARTLAAGAQHPDVLAVINEFAARSRQKQ
ncbi:MAG: enoyl-CoA hydratase/isomerase family protein [Cryobacterium sp.]|nr:enoyl-CoA hydratase/isomerase family protein [Cryobacterium sp.]